MVVGTKKNMRGRKKKKQLIKQNNTNKIQKCCNKMGLIPELSIFFIPHSQLYALDYYVVDRNPNIKIITIVI